MPHLYTLDEAARRPAVPLSMSVITDHVPLYATQCWKTPALSMPRAMFQIPVINKIANTNSKTERFEFISVLMASKQRATWMP